MFLSQAVVAFSLLIVSCHGVRAELSCRDFLRGAQLEDGDVGARAGVILRPLLETKWHSRAMVLDIPNTMFAPDPDAALLVRQIVRDCEALPDETVESVTAVHLKSAKAGEAAAEAKQQVKDAAQAAYERPFKDRERAEAALEAAAPPLPVPLVATAKAMGGISCLTYLREAKGFDSSPVENAFNVALQKLIDADPMAGARHIKIEHWRQYSAAWNGCSRDHGTLANQFAFFLDYSRSDEAREQNVR